MRDNFRELQCAVCSELYVEATSINCGHTFCNYCITWVKRVVLKVLFNIHVWISGSGWSKRQTARCAEQTLSRLYSVKCSMTTWTRCTTSLLEREGRFRDKVWRRRGVKWKEILKLSAPLEHTPRRSLHLFIYYTVYWNGSLLSLESCKRQSLRKPHITTISFHFSMNHEP